MKKLFFSTILVSLLLIPTTSLTNQRVYSWGTVKKHIKKYTIQHNIMTIYAGCKINNDYKVILASCNFKYNLSRSKYKNKGLGTVDVEHIVPSSRLMRHAGCGSQSRYVCRHTNKEFKRCHNNVYNLYPSISVINRYRGNAEFTEIPDEEAYYPFGKKIGFKRSLTRYVVEPPDRSKRRVATSYLKMNELGCINLSVEEIAIFYKWYTTIY